MVIYSCLSSTEQTAALSLRVKTCSCTTLHMNYNSVSYSYFWSDCNKKGIMKRQCRAHPTNKACYKRKMSFSLYMMCLMHFVWVVVLTVDNSIYMKPDYRIKLVTLLILLVVTLTNMHHAKCNKYLISTLFQLTKLIVQAIQYLQLKKQKKQKTENKNN